MSNATEPTASNFRAVTAHLTIPRNAADFVEFTKNAFNAREAGRALGPGGKIMHTEIRIGETVIMVNDDFGAEFDMPPVAQGRWPLVLNITVENADRAWEQAISAGAAEVFPLKNQFWGDRYGQLQDPFGFTWAIAQRIETLSTEELRERQKQAFGG